MTARHDLKPVKHVNTIMRTNKFRQRLKHGGSAKIVISLFVLFSAAIFTSIVIFLNPFRPIVNILMYHSVSGTGHEPDAVVIDKKIFERQLRYLAKHGYKPVFLSSVIQRHRAGKDIPSNWVVLTFDDGKNDFYREVFPLLKLHGFKAVLFVSPGRLESADEYLSWSQLKEIQSSGLVEIGSHGFYHVPFTCLSPPEAEKRIRRSKTLLEEKLGTKIDLFAYPYGALDGRIKAMVQAAGYDGAAGTAYPMGKFMINDVYNMSRIHVSSFSKCPFVFKFMLSGYYVPMRGLLLKIMAIDVPRDVNASDWQAWTNPAFPDE